MLFKKISHVSSFDSKFQGLWFQSEKQNYCSAKRSRKIFVSWGHGQSKISYKKLVEIPSQNKLFLEIIVLNGP